ncbi:MULTISPECIES: RidA family protein [Pseudomonas]|uniref:RidA family protein n=1 Tax=Pseudomonas TaxID=286 RepID=UPI00119F882D|nr:MULTISPECIES: RidA family protein [Pseudomonas]MBI6924329.1 RidA family protein [Pseudomonas putida]
MPTTAFYLSNPQSLYDPSGNGYSHVAEIVSGSRLLFIAGQGGEQASGTLSPVFADQARQAIANLALALSSKGAGLEHVCKLTLLIVDHSEARLKQWVDAVNHAWGQATKPTCTLIPVPRLALDGMLVEVDAVAALPGSSQGR